MQIWWRRVYILHLEMMISGGKNVMQGGYFVCEILCGMSRYIVKRPTVAMYNRGTKWKYKHENNILAR